MKSLHQRLSLFVMGGLAVLIAVGAVVLYAVVRNILIGEFDYALLAKTQALTTLAERGSEGINLTFTELPLTEFGRDESPEYFQIWLGDGSELARSPSLGTNSLPLRAGPEARPVFWDLTLPDGRTGRAVGIGFTIGREDFEGVARMQDFTIATVFARDTIRLQHTLRLLLIGLVLGGGTLLGLSYWVARVATVVGLRPLESMARKVTQVDANSLSTRLPVQDMPTELVPVVRQLNRLLDRLQAAFQRERRVTSNIAHELGTPVAELRLVAEMATRWQNDPEATTQFAQDALEISQQMEQTINTLLLLARSEAGQQQFHSEPVNLVELLHTLRRDLGGQIATRKLGFDCRTPTEAVAPTDPVACKYILRNLLDNAVEYTPVGGEIRCHLDECPDRFELHLANTNPGLTPEDLPHLPEPLWRRDAARSDRNHVGLGLTLVDALAAALQFKIHFELAGDGLFRVVVCIPRLKTSAIPVDVATSSKPVALLSATRTPSLAAK